MEILYFPATGTPLPQLISIDALSRVQGATVNGDSVPLAHRILRGHPTIPIHTTTVTLNHDQETHTFSLSYRYDRRLMKNRALNSVNPDVAWFGDLAVCKYSTEECYAVYGV